MNFKLTGAALVLSALAATAASAQVSEPAAAEAQDPNFSIYSSGPAYGYPPPVAVRPLNPGAMAEMRTPERPHRAHHAPVRHY